MRSSSVSPRARSSIPRPPSEDKDENGSGGETRQILRQRVELLLDGLLVPTAETSRLFGSGRNRVGGPLRPSEHLFGNRTC